MVISVVVLGVFVMIVLMIDNKKKISDKMDIPNRTPEKSISLDQKIKLERTELIQQVTAAIAQIKNQSIDQVVASLNSVKSSRRLANKDEER